MLRYILLPLLAISASAFILERNPCKQPGFFAAIDNAPAFYGCYPRKDGGFELKVLSCPAGKIFNAAAGHCVLKVKLQVDDIDDYSPIDNDSSTQPDIENPTVPTHPTTSNMEETTDASEETTNAPEETTEGSGSSTDEPETTDVSTESTDKPSEPTNEPTQSTDKPTESTDGPTVSTDETTDKPHETTDEPTESTDESTDTTDETTDTTDETPTLKPFLCPTTGFFPADGACDKFIYCMSNTADTVPIELQCPPNQHFNPSTLFCETSYNCNGGSIAIVEQIEYDCIMEGIFPDHEDQAKYILCTWNEKVKAFKAQQKDCPENEIFHKLTGRCGRHLQLPKTLLHLGHH